MWYAQKVLEAVEKGTKLWKTAFSKSSLDIKILQETFLREASRFAGEESTPAVQTVLSSFRELCSLTWMLYVRDKLSLCLRDKAKMAEKKLRKSITEEEWLAHCELTLKWTKQLLPFSAYLSGNSDLHGILLSLILELPHSADTAKLMAEYFSHPETMAPEIQDKLQWILKEWQGVFLKSTNTWKLVDREGRTKVESPHGVTMSLFFNSNLDRADRMMKKRRKLFGLCEDQVFVGEMLRQKKLVVGSRYFESTQEYLEFLDVLYAVSFHRLMDSGQEKPSTSHPDQPLLVQYSKLHKEIELGSTSHEVKRSEKMFRGGNTVAMTPSPKPVIQLSSGVDVDDPTSGVSPQQHRAKGLLSRGKPKTKTDAVKSGSSKPRAVNGSGSDDGDRSLHMSDLDDDTTANKTKQVAARDPLLPPLMPGKMLDGTRLDKRFTRVEQLLDWLSVWAGRNHTLLAHNTTSGSSSTSAIRVRVSPRMITYSLWLLENCYNPPPSVTAAATARPEHFGEITVATVCCHSPKDSNPEERRESTTRTGKDDGTDPRKSKKKKNKKKKKKSEVRGKPEGDILPQSSGDTPDVRTDEESWKSTSILLNSEADKHVATESMKSDQSKLFSINEADSTEAQSEMTLTFSSLRDEDLKQTIKETVSKMSQSIHYGEQDGDFTSHHTSLNAAMNNTLRFRDTDQSKRGQRSPQQRQPSPEDYTRARQSASQQSDVSTVAQELQGIVRQELRKIMEAQHKGILAMLGALDDNDDGANDLQSRMTTKSSVTTTPHKQSIRATPQRGLTLSQLADGRELATSEAESGLGQALRQMRLLEGDQRAITQQGGHAPSRSQPGASGARQELYEIDLDLPGQHPRLLHIPSKQPNQGLHLPNIPQQAWSEKSTPLLHTDHRLQDIPERDITTDIQMSKGQTSVLNSLPFPLLTLNQSSVGRGSFTGDQPRIPSLIPPEEILLYEERKYKTNVLKAREVFEFVNEQMANQMAAQKQPEPLGKKLLKPDVFEPFGPLDERDKKQREKHRGKKLTNNNTQSRQKTLSKERLDVENRSTEDTLHSLTESELRREMADYVKESDRKGKQHKRAREENKTHENAQLDDDVPINHGYALTPGLFDEYLKNQDELGSAIETNARIQYRAATGVQTTPRTQKDACTETSLADKERAMALSAGTDPVSDAIKKYYEAKTGHTSTILSPDVFLALRFDGTNNAPEANGSQPSRAFLNVVDINADILDEIASTAQERESSKQVAQRTEFTLPSQRIAAAAAAAHREQSSVVPHPERDYVEGGDHTTARLLGQSASPVDPITAEAVMYTSRRQRTRDDIHKKLENMNMQFNAIDSMNTSIEREFKDSELILHTIEKMAESLVPEKTVSPSRQQQEQQQQQDWQTAEQDVTHDHPSSKVSPAKEKKVQITDNVNQRKEEMVDGELRTSKDDTGGTQDLGNSGLSGVSDILGEMLLRGDMTRQQLGLSEKQAEHLREKARAATSLSQEELQKVFARKPSPDDKPQTEEQIKELHQWMAEKKKERLKQYKEQLNQLRAGEHHPYQPQESPRGKQHKGQTEKKQQSEEFMKKREEEASKLMGDILADLSAMPVTSSSPMTSRRGKETKVDTPRSERKVGKKAAKGISGKTVVRKIFRSSANNLCTGSPVRDQSAVDHMDLAVDGYMHRWADHMTSTRVIKPRDGQHSAAAAAAAQRDVVRSQSAPATPTQARKQKKLTDLVRLQRPEVTRQSHHVKRKPLTYTERLAQLQADGSTARTTSSAREQYKIYGSKHLPGSARLTQRKAPRVVKTYTERLAELRKQGERPSTADDTMSRLWSVQRRGISPRKPGKTLTYAERLQQLQPSKGTTRSSTGVVKPPAKPGYKWHKAPHKPKTYVEQLQELQKPATVRPTDMYKPKDYPSQSVAGVGRSRPYGDPYTETDDERLSMVSPWSVEEDVKRLLYEEDSIMERFSAVASDGDVSEMSEIQYYVGDEPEEYTDLVDVDQLAEIASVSEGSVMSFIDWDQVDKLIAEA